VARLVPAFQELLEALVGQMGLMAPEAPVDWMAQGDQGDLVDRAGHLVLVGLADQAGLEDLADLADPQALVLLVLSMVQAALEARTVLEGLEGHMDLGDQVVQAVLEDLWDPVDLVGPAVLGDPLLQVSRVVQVDRVVPVDLWVLVGQVGQVGQEVPAVLGGR
jgi:hypothetical protein